MSRLRKCRPTHAVVSLVHTCRHVGRHFSIGQLFASADKFLCRCPSPIYWPDLSTRRFYVGRYENVGCGGVVQWNANISTNVIVQPDNYVGPYSRRTIPTPKERKAIPCPCSQLVQFRHPILPRFAVIIFLKGTSPLELRKIYAPAPSQSNIAGGYQSNVISRVHPNATSLHFSHKPLDNGDAINPISGLSQCVFVGLFLCFVGLLPR